MKILLIEFRDPSHPEAGGAERLLFEIFTRLSSRGHQITYLCSRYSNAARSETVSGIRIVRFGSQMFFNWLVPLFYLFRLKRLQNFDLVVEGLDKVPFFMPLFERRMPVLCLVPHLFGTTIHQQAPWPVALYVRLMEKAIPLVYRHNLFSALSESTRQDLVARGIGSERIKVIHPGINPQFAPAANRPPNARPTLIYLGRLKSYKRIDLILHAVAALKSRIPAILLQIAGHGDARIHLEKLAGNLGLEKHLLFIGAVTEDEKIRLLQHADILVYTSQKEGWGLPVTEAQACGAVPVVSDSPGLRDAVQNGAGGFLVPHGDVKSLSDKIWELLSDSVLLEESRMRGIASSRQFSWERAASATAELMQNAIAAHAMHAKRGTLLDALDQSSLLHSIAQKCHIRHIANAWLRRFPISRTLSGSGVCYEISDLESLCLGDEIFARELYSPAFSGAPVETFVDMGANVGMFPCYALHATRNRNIVGLCVEANPNLIPRAQKAVQTNGLQGVQIVHGFVGGALGREASFHIYASHLGSSCRPVHPPGTPPRGGWQKIAVPTVEIAALWKKLAGERRVNLLKIDIEGSEVDWMKAEFDFLKNVDRIFVESHPWLAPTVELEALAEKAGFKKLAHTRKPPDAELLYFSRL